MTGANIQKFSVSDRRAVIHENEAQDLGERDDTEDRANEKFHRRKLMNAVIRGALVRSMRNPPATSPNVAAATPTSVSAPQITPRSGGDADDVLQDREERGPYY